MLLGRLCPPTRDLLASVVRNRAATRALASIVVPGDECTALLKNLLGHTGQQVCILTVANERGMCGTTVSSFHSCSMDPPMVFFNIGCKSTLSHLLLADDSCFSGTPFIAHIMAENGEPLARYFSQPHMCNAKFDAVDWRPSGEPFQQPVLIDGPRAPLQPFVPKPPDDAESPVLGWMECVTESAVPAGKNWVLIAKVLRVHCRAMKQGARPLLYCEGKYTGVHPPRPVVQPLSQVEAAPNSRPPTESGRLKV